MVITDFLEKNARFYGSDPAIVEINPTEERDNANTWREASLIELAKPDAPYRREITWRMFNKKANQVAHLLLARNIKKGTKVGILLMNCVEWLPIYFGILKAGCICVPLNYRYTADEIDYCLTLADVEILIFGYEFIDRIASIKDKIKNVKNLFYVGFDKPDFSEDLLKLANYCSYENPPIKNSEDDIAAIYFSSGTTGFPKAILHRHKALTASCMTEQNHHKQTKDDVFLCIPPLYHTGAKMHWFGSLYVGAKSVILRGIKPEWIFRTITEEKCTIVWLLVPRALDILESLDDGRLKIDDYLLDQWWLMHIGAQPVPPSLIKRWLKYFPNHKYDTNYGLSESLGPGCVHLGIDNINKVGAIGKPGYQWEAKILDNNGNETKTDVPGELCVKGPGVMLGYYKNEKATNEVLFDGWLRTGDMAKVDKDGFIFLVDRKKDVIISGGENIYPVQIEDYLHNFVKLKDVAVIGLPDKRLGEIVVAVIELKDGENATDEEVFSFCKELPRYKRPKKIIFDKVPRNPTGKIEKPVLRKRYCDVPLVEMQVTS